MRAKKNQTLAELRRIIGRTQTEFGELIGASKDTVVSWENGRNRISPAFSYRIWLATGADIVSSTVPLNLNRQPYTFADYKAWKESRIGVHPEQRLFDKSADALWLIFSAAAKPGPGKLKDQLTGVWCSFVAWLEQTRVDFKLEQRIDELLDQRVAAVESKTMTWGEWRKAPAVIREFYGFKDDKRQSAKRELTLRMPTHPVWNAQSDMRAKGSR
ncbi:MAG TPA: helix-turn-helix transcriptional regulator [Candidatus Paceibacterota bacterium]|nr:helix-turn-helix transcriptional regulator [Candidatus Paceibacterota bacterium]